MVHTGQMRQVTPEVFKEILTLECFQWSSQELVSSSLEVIFFSPNDSERDTGSSVIFIVGNKIQRKGRKPIRQDVLKDMESLSLGTGRSGHVQVWCLPVCNS